MSLAGKSQHENQEWELWSKKRSAFFNLGLCHFLAYETTVSHQKIRHMMTCAISPAAKLWGFCHLHLIIASLETLRLGAVTKKRNKKDHFTAENTTQNLFPGFAQQIQACMRTAFLQPLHELLCGLGTRHSKQLRQAKRDTSVYKMLHVSLDLPIKSTVSFLH